MYSEDVEHNPFCKHNHRARLDQHKYKSILLPRFRVAPSTSDGELLLLLVPFHKPTTSTRPAVISIGTGWDGNGHSTHWTSAGLLLFDWSPVVCLYFKAININQDRNRKVKASGQWRIKEQNMTFHLIVIGKLNLITGELANRKLWNVLTFREFKVSIRGLFIYFLKIS